MRRVWEQPEEARTKAKRARADIQRQYAPEAAGAVARARLERLADRGSGARATRDLAENPFEEIERELAVDVRLGAPPVSRGASGLLRRLVLRLMLPFTFHERKLDWALFNAVRDLRAELLSERVRHRRDRERLERVEDAVNRPNDEKINRTEG
jgi:hypothetical protein